MRAIIRELGDLLVLVHVHSLTLNNYWLSTYY